MNNGIKSKCLKALQKTMLEKYRYKVNIHS